MSKTYLDLDALRAEYAPYDRMPEFEAGAALQRQV